MLNRSILALCAVFALAALAFMTGRSLAEEAPAAVPLGPAFSYQGQLDDGGEPVNGRCDFQFALYDAATRGSQIGSTQQLNNVSVDNGSFTVTLNSRSEFGKSPFQEDGRWLEIAVRCPATAGDFTTLTPRQPITAAPFAHYSQQTSWSGVLNIPAGFADDIDNDTTYTAGNGLSLTDTAFEAIGSPLENIIVVAKSGGDFDTIGAALDSISDNGPTNRYQIFVGPGDYSEIVTLKPYVDLVGSGPNTTRLLHDGVGGFAVLETADNSEIRDLTVENDGSGTSNFSIAINNDNSSPRITNVTAVAYGGSFNYAIYNQSGAHPILQNVRSTASGGSSAIGMYQFSSNSTSYGSHFWGEDDTNGIGVYTTHSGTDPYRVELISSVISGTHTTLRISSNFTILVANSALGGGGSINNVGSGTLTCIASRDDNDTALDSSCSPAAPGISPSTASGTALELTCGNQDAVLNHTNLAPAAASIMIEEGETAGRCVIDFGVPIGDALWSVSPVGDAEPRVVGCQQLDETSLSCLQSTMTGDGINGPIMIVLH